MATKSQIGVRALVVTGGGLVVVEHEEKGKRLMVFPGGGLEEGETIFEGAVREVKEETGLDVAAERVVYAREILAGKDHGVEFYILCRIKGGEMTLGSDPEHEDGNFILKDVHEVAIENFVSMDNWYPTELHAILEKDFKDNFPEPRFLGTVRF